MRFVFSLTPNPSPDGQGSDVTMMNVAHFRKINQEE